MQIHELNTFLGNLDASAFVAVDNGNDTGKASIKAITDPLNNRIDNIIAGPAPSAAEIIDAREGASGTVYPSLGSAIRSQITDLKTPLDKISFDVEGVAPVNLSFEQGAYLSNGFSNSGIRIRAEIEPGTYIFTPSSAIYFSIVYYDSDSSGTPYINMGNVLVKAKLTITRTAWITIQYRNSSAIIPANNDELSIGAYRGDSLLTMPALRENRVAELKSDGGFKSFEHLIGRSSYYVGENRSYQTIGDALSAWANDSYPPANIYIENGEYNEVVEINSKDISLIGESREGTIIRTTTGKYIDAPVHILHGNVSVENMTIIADHSSDPDFDYEAENNTVPAYGVHVDGGTIAGKVIIKNCNIISYQSPAIGLGTIPDSLIRIENCVGLCYTDATTVTTSKQYRALQYGCLICHMSSPENYPIRGTETLQLVNTKLFAKNTKNVVTLKYGSDLTEHLNVLAINNVLGSDTENDINALFVPDAGLIVLDSQSQGNTCLTMDYSV